MRQMAWLPMIAVLAVLVVACAPDPRDEAISAFQVGKIAEAKLIFERSVDRKPGDPESLYYMGRIACVEQEWEKAYQFFERCLNADPFYPTARQWMQYAEDQSGLGDKLRSTPALPPRKKLPG